MSRTDELRGGGGRERGGSGGGAPFVKWPEQYSWLEGKVVSTFETKYGVAAVFDVTNVGGADIPAHGRDEDGNDINTTVGPGGEFAVGTQAATLQGKITADDIGKSFHVAFEGWEQGKQNKYRVFTVIELAERSEETPAQAAAASAPTDDGLPF